MLSFTGSFSTSSDSFTVFVTEKFELKESKKLLSQESLGKINSFLKILKRENVKEEINSIDISENKKCFIIKVKDKYENNYPEETGGMFFPKFSLLNRIGFSGIVRGNKIVLNTSIFQDSSSIFLFF